MAQYCLMSRSIMIFSTDSPEVVHTSVCGWLYTRQWERRMRQTSILLLANLLKVLLKYLMPSLHSSSLYPCLLILQPQRLCCAAALSSFHLCHLKICYSNEISSFTIPHFVCYVGKIQYLFCLSAVLHLSGKLFFFLWFLCSTYCILICSNLLGLLMALII